MSETESQLLGIYKEATVKLEDVCEHYLGLSPGVARHRAATNKLPFPTFRLSSSNKSPVMVKISDLAALIDSQHTEAARERDSPDADL